MKTHSVSRQGTSYSSLNYAFCEFAYALCKDSSDLDPAQKKKLYTILSNEFKDNKDLVRYVLQKDSMDVKIAHLWILREIENVIEFHYLEEKEKFERVIRQIMVSFPEKSQMHSQIGLRFLNEIKMAK